MTSGTRPSPTTVAISIGLASSDGLRWRLVQEDPIVVPPERDAAFDSHNIAFWDSTRQQYVIYARGWYRHGRRPAGATVIEKKASELLMRLPSGEILRVARIRDIRRLTSPDFINWSVPEYIGLSSRQLEHLYKNSAVLYYQNPALVLMFPKRFVPARKFDAAWPAQGLSDVVFMFSRDGLHFDRRFMEAFLRPGRNPLNWHERAIQIGSGLVPTGPGEMSLYFVEQAKSTSVRIRRAVLREDGFVSLRAAYREGTITTRPFRFSGTDLLINYATSAAGSIRVEIRGADGNPKEGFGLANCPEIYGDEIVRKVAWNTHTDVRVLAGQVIRLNIKMKDADLYSFQFK